MREGARIAAAIEIVGIVLKSNLPLKGIVKNYFLKRKYAGSSDRKKITDLVYNTFRDYPILYNICSHNNYDCIGRNLVLSECAIREGMQINFPELFKGKYSIKEEKSDVELFKKTQKFSILSKHRISEWLYDEALRSFGKDYDKVLESLRKPPTVDLRVNSLLTDRNTFKRLLKKKNIESEFTRFSPNGLRLNKRYNLKSLEEFNKGYAEFQNEGAQIVTRLLGAKGGMKVLDLCAGKGGKTLAMWSDMNGNGQIIATDISEKRLNFLRKKIVKYGLSEIKIIPYNTYFKDKFDLVLADVPCSGSGTWRRRPEEAIRLTDRSFKKILKFQKNILKNSAQFVATGGILAYVTCSLFKSENEDQVLDFLKNNSRFELIDLRLKWKGKLSCKPNNISKPWFALRPDIDNTDGFFVTLFKCI